MVTRTSLCRVSRISRISRIANVGFALAAVPLASCGALIGLEDHELATSAGDASIDAGPCGACANGYACVDGRCGNEVIEVAASGTHACAVLRAGEVWCWGKSQLGALGVDAASTPARCGTFACRAAPARVPGVKGIIHVSAADDATCALANDGTVSCWGRNARGELGHDPASDPQCLRHVAGDPATDACTAKPTSVALPGSALVVQLVMGSDAACARTTTGQVYCWGDDYLAIDGVYPLPATGFVPAASRIDGINGKATSIALSGALAHGCALAFFNTVWCWGSNNTGELGHPKGQNGDKACIFTVPCAPVAQGAAGASGTALASGDGVSCVRRGDGTVACWGANDAAQLANGASVDTDPHPTPQVAVGLVNVAALEVRYKFGFAIDGASRVHAWGLASNGALGTPAASIACADGACVPTPALVPALEGAVQISSSRAGGVALKNDGSVWTWGINDLAQLGHAPGDGDATCKDGPCRELPSRLVGLP
jgi:alpha-tubulin suppressor-like RCC1 family protein